jgi:uncharacterized protein
MIENAFYLAVEQEIITGLIMQDGMSKLLPDFIFLHGGGETSYKERVYDIAEPIIKNNHNILSIDFSGHGTSTGELKKGSLKKRVIEAQAAIIAHAATSPLIICGASMGSYIALKMLERFQVDTLILMCPALYDGQAYNVQFDQGFTEILRRPESWQNTDVLDTLRAFTGKLLIIIGDKDEVIPAGIIELILQNSVNVQKKELYIIPQCPHKINVWLADNPQELRNMRQKIDEFLQ